MRHIEVAAGIIEKTATAHSPHMILAGLRKKGDLKSYWEFPGGKLETGERPEDACIRELQEELKVSVYNLRRIAIIEHDYKEQDLHVRLHCFLCQCDEEPVNTEHGQLRWLSAQDIKTVCWLPADLELVELLAKYLEHGSSTSFD